MIGGVSGEDDGVEGTGELDGVAVYERIGGDRLDWGESAGLEVMLWAKTGDRAGDGDGDGVEGCVDGVVGEGDEQSRGEGFGGGRESESEVAGGGRGGVESKVKEESGKEKISKGESAAKEESGGSEKGLGAGIVGSKRGEGGRGGSEARERARDEVVGEWEEG